ncbi:hypothetical protein ACSBR1_022633 [Camellia fascicularis]
MYRDPGYYWWRLAMYMALGSGLGSVFYDVGPSYGSIHARGSMLVASFLTTMAIGGFPSFIEEMKVFGRERLNGHYGAGAFVVGNTLSSTPYSLLISLIPGAIAYYLVGLHGGSEHGEPYDDCGQYRSKFPRGSHRRSWNSRFDDVEWRILLPAKRSPQDLLEKSKPSLETLIFVDRGVGFLWRFTRESLKFYEELSNKARPKPRHSSSHEDNLAQRLEAKLQAAEQKRLNILAKSQMRLSKLDELRQAAKTGLEMRFKKECAELGTKVESRVQQAEANKMLILKVRRQQRATIKERASQSLL